MFCADFRFYGLRSAVGSVIKYSVTGFTRSTNTNRKESLENERTNSSKSAKGKQIIF